MEFKIHHNKKYKLIPRDCPNSRVNNRIFKIKNFVMAVVGSKGTGKTSFCVNLLLKGCPYHKYFRRIYIFSPTRDQKFMKLGLKESRFVIMEQLGDIIEHIKTKKGKTLFIFDDCLGDLNRNTDLNGHLSNATLNSHHLNLSCIFLVQSCQPLPTYIKKNIDIAVLLSPMSSIELRICYQYFGLGYSWDNFKKVFHEATKRPYHPLIILLKSTSGSPFMSGFDEMKIIKK